MNENAKLNVEYWHNRYHDTERSGGNFDTMICWSKEEYADEAAKLSEKIYQFIGWDLFYKIIDFGCGRGRFAHLFENYAGVDILPAIIEKNREKYPDKNFSVIPNAPDPSYELPSAGVIFAFTVLQHIDDETLRIWLRIFKRSATKLFIAESVGAKNEHTYRRDWTEFLQSERYGIQKRETFKSREMYDFIWAT